MRRCLLILVAGLLFCTKAWGNDVTIVDAKARLSGGSWTFHVTLQHADSGWEHYADAWRVVDAAGRVLATRTLYHPHVEEQPFTRSLGGVQIPAGIDRVFVEAHDKVHGWAAQRFPVNLVSP